MRIHIKGDVMNTTQNFYLLQINDALFPIGAYSHSYGLETYIQNGLLHDAQDAATYLSSKLKYSILYSDLLGARLAYEYTENDDLESLISLNHLTEALKTPTEIREASLKLGSRFIKTISSLDLVYNRSLFNDFISHTTDKKFHHCCLYGSFCAAMNINQLEMLSHYLYAQASSIVTTCVKSIPLSQTDGQKILSSSFPLLTQLLQEVICLDAKWYGCSTPGFDIRSMQHEHLYSRIYMS